MNTIKISLPVYYLYKYKRPKTVRRKTKKGYVTKVITERNIFVGLNWFRNENPFTKDVVKQHYHKLVSDALRGSKTKIEGQYTTKYKFFYKSKVCDATNVIPMIEKFFLDALQELEVTKEDNVLHHIGSDGWSVEYDKDNPRVEIEIRSV